MARFVELETSESTNHATDITASGLRGLLLKMESRFKVLGQRNAASGGIKGEVGEVDAPFPLVESLLLGKLSDRTALVKESKKRDQALKNIVKTLSSSPSPKTLHWESLDFNVMFDKLVAYKDMHGHQNVPGI